MDTNLTANPWSTECHRGKRVSITEKAKKL